MTQGKHITGFMDLLLKCIAEPEPILSMLECLPEESLTRKKHTKASHNDNRCGYCSMRLEPVWGFSLIVPKLHRHRYLVFSSANVAGRR